MISVIRFSLDVIRNVFSFGKLIYPSLIATKRPPLNNEEIADELSDEAKKARRIRSLTELKESIEENISLINQKEHKKTDILKKIDKDSERALAIQRELDSLLPQFHTHLERLSQAKAARDRARDLIRKEENLRVSIPNKERLASETEMAVRQAQGNLPTMSTLASSDITSKYHDVALKWEQKARRLRDGIQADQKKIYQLRNEISEAQRQASQIDELQNSVDIISKNKQPLEEFMSYYNRLKNKYDELKSEIDEIESENLDVDENLEYYIDKNIKLSDDAYIHLALDILDNQEKSILKEWEPDNLMLNGFLKLTHSVKFSSLKNPNVIGHIAIQIYKLLRHIRYSISGHKIIEPFSSAFKLYNNQINKKLIINKLISEVLKRDQLESAFDYASKLYGTWIKVDNGTLEIIRIVDNFCFTRVFIPYLNGEEPLINIDFGNYFCGINSSMQYAYLFTSAYKSELIEKSITVQDYFEQFKYLDHVDDERYQKKLREFYNSYDALLSNAKTIRVNRLSILTVKNRYIIGAILAFSVFVFGCLLKFKPEVLPVKMRYSMLSMTQSIYKPHDSIDLETVKKCISDFYGHSMVINACFDVSSYRVGLEYAKKKMWHRASTWLQQSDYAETIAGIRIMCKAKAEIAERNQQAIAEALKWCHLYQKKSEGKIGNLMLAELYLMQHNEEKSYHYYLAAIKNKDKEGKSELCTQGGFNYRHPTQHLRAVIAKEAKRCTANSLITRNFWFLMTYHHSLIH